MWSVTLTLCWAEKVAGGKRMGDCKGMHLWHIVVASATLHCPSSTLPLLAQLTFLALLWVAPAAVHPFMI
jgi:hypothetical protein